MQGGGSGKGIVFTETPGGVPTAEGRDCWTLRRETPRVPTPPLGRRAWARPHGPPHPSRERESEILTVGEIRMILKTDQEIRKPEHPKADLGCDGIGLKRHCHNVTISKG